MEEESFSLRMAGRKMVVFTTGIIIMDMYMHVYMEMCISRMFTHNKRLVGCSVGMY